MGLPKPEHLPHYTYDDYKIWEGNWELIDGIPYAMTPAPSVYHQEINGNLYAIIRQALSGCSQCKALLPVDWKINEDTVVQPDVSIICFPLGKEVYIAKAPSIIFEILSPSTAQKDRTLKYDLYQSQGVTYYVIVNPLLKSVELFKLVNGKYEQVKETPEKTFDFDLTEEAACTFSLKFNKIW